ncbi:MAG: hypothetical protein AABX29_05240 [Nanoarchaeota archaeon]
MNKKGGGDILSGKTGYYIIYIFIFAICIAIAAAYINNKVTVDVDFSRLEMNVISSMVFDCLKGNQFGIIDYNKFKNENLKECFDENTYHVKVKLRESGEIRNFDFSSQNSAEYYVLVDKGELQRDFLYLEFENAA